MTSYPPVARCTLHPLKGGMQRNGLRLGVVANETGLQRALQRARAAQIVHFDAREGLSAVGAARAESPHLKPRTN